MCHWFFCCTFCKYRPIFITFWAQFCQKMPEYLVQEFPRRAFVLLLPYCVKSVTFHATFAPCSVFISNQFTEISIDKTNKKHQKVILWFKYMFKISPIHRNTCTQTTTSLHNRYSNDGVVQQPPLPQQTFFQLLRAMDLRTVESLLKGRRGWSFEGRITWADSHLTSLWKPLRWNVGLSADMIRGVQSCNLVTCSPRLVTVKRQYPPRVTGIMAVALWGSRSLVAVCCLL